MIIMNKYCETKWKGSRAAYTIRSKKYRRIEELKFQNTSTSVNTDNKESRE